MKLISQFLTHCSLSISIIMSFIFCSAFAQQSNLQSTRPFIFTKPVELNWKSIPFESINYNQTSLDGGALLYDLPSQTALKFSLKVVLPVSIFSLLPEERTSYGAFSDLLILGGFGPLTFEQIQNTLSENGINLTTNINQNGQVVVSADALASDFDLVLNLVQNLLFSPQFSKTSLDIWKQQNKDAFTSLLDANTLEKQMRFVDNQANILAFGKNHYFSQTINRISPEKINQVTTEKIIEIYKKAFNRNGLKIWLAGKYTSKNLLNLSEIVSHIPKSSPPVRTWLPARSLVKNNNNKILTVILKKPDMTQCNITLRYYFPHIGKLNEIEKMQYSLLSEIFSSSGGIVGNDRFSKAMRADSGISYSPYAYFNNEVLYPNTNMAAFYLNFQTPNERLAEAVTLAKKTWDTFLTEGISKEELDISRTALMNRLLASERTIFDKSGEIMTDVLKGKTPNNNPIEYNLVKLEQLQDVSKINDILNYLAKEEPLPVLVIMGNPNEEQIKTLLKKNQFNLIDSIDFSKFAHSFF